MRKLIFCFVRFCLKQNISIARVQVGSEKDERRG